MRSRAMVRRLADRLTTATRDGYDPIPYLAGGEWYVAIGTRFRDHEFRLSRDDLEQLAGSIGELLDAVDERWPEPTGGGAADDVDDLLGPVPDVLAPPEHAGGNAEECPACDLTPPALIPYPWHCPGPGAIVRGPGEVARVWWMYATDDEGVLMNVGSREYVEGHRLALPVVRVEVRLDPYGAHWGWLPSDGEPPVMIWPSWAQLSMCFHYGVEAEERAGRGRAVRLAVGTVREGATPSERLNRRAVERLERRMEAEGGA